MQHTRSGGAATYASATADTQGACAEIGRTAKISDLSKELLSSFRPGPGSPKLPGSQERPAGRRPCARGFLGQVVAALTRPYPEQALDSPGLHVPHSQPCTPRSAASTVASPGRVGRTVSCSHKAARAAVVVGSCSQLRVLRPPSGRAELPAARAGWQLEWVREPPPPPPLPPPPPPGPFAAERGERGGAAGAAMEPDSVIEDKTIELMVSAARWPSVLPADWRSGGLPTSASAPGQPSFPAARARPAPCRGSLLTPRAPRLSGPPLPPTPSTACRAPTGLGRPCLAPP